jgi:Domain of unknown function (DUF3854)
VSQSWTADEYREWTGKLLLPQHHEQLLASAISLEVAAARGYWSATTRRQLRDLGFSDKQQQVVRDPARSLDPAAALVVPLWWINPSEPVLFQVRPDKPWRAASGRPAKYLTPKDAGVKLDVHPSMREALGNPEVPLVTSEGTKKVDAAATAGLCCVGLLGVDNWRGRNALGGLTALAQWNDVHLRSRSVLLCFDSDVATNTAVYEALRRFKEFLASRQAKVATIYIPSGPNGQKQGLDDYLAAGHTKDDLLALATDQLREPPKPESREPGVQVWELRDYTMIADRGIFRGRGNDEVQLTDFAAFVKRKVIEDDGVEQRQRYELAVQQGARIEQISIMATEFEGLRWTRRLNTLDPYVAAGTSVRDHARAAIDLASKDISTRAHVYTHLGWCKTGDRWCYLHAGGGIGEDGPTDGVEVELQADLARFRLPEPPTGDAEREAVRQSLGLLGLAPDQVMVPLLAATYRAPLGYVDNTVYLVGQTGVYKSELTALIQQHYGPELYREQLPGSWGSTANSLRAQLFLCKDAPFVVDDFAPGGGRIDRESWDRKAAEILRAQGNMAGRGRAAADGGLRPIKPPRALLITSGEDVPSGHSVRARNVIIDVNPGDVDLARLTVAQRTAAAGVYAQAMSCYLRWLAPQMDEVPVRLRELTIELRDRLRGSHPRTPTAMAQLAVGFHVLLRYAEVVGAIDEAGRGRLWSRGMAAFGQLAAAQARHQEEAEPTARFFDLLAAAITSGRAHVAATDGTEPWPAEAWGWRPRGVVMDGDGLRTRYEAQLDRVGWLDGENLYLQPEASYRVAQLMAGDGAGIGVGQKTLSKRLKDKRLLLSSGKDRAAVRRRVEGGAERWVLHVHAERLRAMSAKESVSAVSAVSGTGPGADLNSDEDLVRPIFETDQGLHGGQAVSQIGLTATRKGGSETDETDDPDPARTGVPEFSVRARHRQQHERQVHAGRPVEWWQHPDGTDVCGTCHPQPKQEEA